MKCAQLGVLWLAVSACDPGGPTQLEATSVTLRLVNPAGIERPEALRMAVVWRTGQTSGTPWLTTFDVGLSDTQQSQRVRVELPEGVKLDELPDPVSIRMRCDAWPAERAWPGVRPLWLVYQDLDRNERLDGVGADRIWAITDFSREHLVAFADFEKALSEVSLEDGECLRRANGGGFSPFVSGAGSVYFYVSSAARSEFTLTLNPSGFPGVLLRCGSSYSASQNPVLKPTLLAVAPDLAFDGCTDEATCTRVSYQNDWTDATQAFYAPGFYRAPYCVRAGELEVLWVLEGRSECTDCSCVSHVQRRAWLVSRAATPPDWPCGGLVQLCDTPSDQAEVIPSDCLL